MRIDPETKVADILDSHEKRLRRVERAALAVLATVTMDAAVSLVHELVKQFNGGK